MAGPVDSESAARRHVLSVFLQQGLAGLVVMVAVTWVRRGEASAVMHALGPDAPLLILVFIAFSAVLGFLKFELTNLIFVSLGMIAYIAMPPLLGMVLASWITVLVAMAVRLLGMYEIGPVKVSMQNPVLEYVKTLGLFGTYGVPVVAASMLYEALGGAVPVMKPTFAEALRIALAGLALIVTNNLMMFRVARAYGYSVAKVLKLDVIDSSIYLLTIPYSVIIALSYASLGWGGVLALAFTGIVANLVARNLAFTRSRSERQLQRLASLTNIGKTISLRFTTDQLLMAVYTECKKIIDCSLFTIALLDESSNELSFELDVRNEAILPKDRLPVGEGLNSWVISHHQPLLLGSTADEHRYGIRSVPDSKPSESWLGVPMIARDHVIGVISVESYNKHAFTTDDVILMTAIANQAAVAIENAQLYKDLEGLTYALEQRVMERTNELREANLRLMAADRSKNQFLANMSHELRTPLNSIIGFSSVLLESTRNTLAPRLYKFLENIHAAGNHLLELINDILDLSKIEAGKMELRADDFDLRETITAVERVMKGFASEARVRIISTIEPGVPRVRLDEGRLKQILFNLLSNAVKFSAQGGLVRVSIGHVGKDESPIGVETVRIAVADEGIGIPTDELQRIFVEFYQTEDGRRARKGGTGLGLSLTRNFVELHHGTIDVQSTPGEGSTFTLFLPVDYDEASTAALPIPTLRASAGAHESRLH
jgi:signal transduction histidine kinase